MLFRGWDPGILGDSRTRSGVYRKDTIIRIWIPKGILEKSLIEDLQGFIRVGIGRIRDSPSSSKGMRNPEDRTKDPRGMNFVLIITRSLPPVIESRNIIMRYANDTMDTWLLDRISFGVLGCRNRFSNDCSKIC